MMLHNIQHQLYSTYTTLIEFTMQNIVLPFLMRDGCITLLSLLVYGLTLYNFPTTENDKKTDGLTLLAFCNQCQVETCTNVLTMQVGMLV